MVPSFKNSGGAIKSIKDFAGMPNLSLIDSDQLLRQMPSCVRNVSPYLYPATGNTRRAQDNHIITYNITLLSTDRLRTCL